MDRKKNEEKNKIHETMIKQYKQYTIQLKNQIKDKNKRQKE